MQPAACHLITLLTDFGLDDPYAGILKGVILGIHPACQIVDITHGIAPQDIMTAAIVLRASYRFFPKKTIHVAVVDPGVGGVRRALLVETEDYFFVGPDNGILSPVLEQEKDLKIYLLTQDRFFIKPVSQTFHGRDIFAPVAAWLSRGTPPGEFGPPVQDLFRLSFPHPRRSGRRIIGTILTVDKFGNLITNLTTKDLPTTVRKFTLYIAGQEIRDHFQFYAEAKLGQAFTIYGSSGYLEISVNQGSAARLLNIRAFDEFEIEFPAQY